MPKLAVHVQSKVESTHPGQSTVLHSGVLMVQGAAQRRADRLEMRRALELHHAQRPSLDGSPATAAVAAAAAARPFGMPPPDSPPAPALASPAAAFDGNGPDQQLREGQQLGHDQQSCDGQLPTGGQQLDGVDAVDGPAATSAAAEPLPAGQRSNGATTAADLHLPQMLRVISVGDRISDIGNNPSGI